jgi:hypothetical protein
MSEEEKAERRRVVANNKDWGSATTVRKEWLTGFLARKSAPKDAARYIAATLARGGHDVRKAMENAHPTACELLGLDPPAGCYSGKPNPISIALETAPAGRATVITLAVLLGAAEDGTGRSSWRTPTCDTRAYFSALAAWGYPLCPVEQLVCNPDGPAVAEDTAIGEDPGNDADAGAEEDHPAQPTPPGTATPRCALNPLPRCARKAAGNAVCAALRAGTHCMVAPGGVRRLRSAGWRRVVVSQRWAAVAVLRWSARMDRPEVSTAVQGRASMNPAHPSR